MDYCSGPFVFLLGAIPLFEARYAIPAAIVAGCPLQQAFTLGVAGNLAPVVPLLLLLDPVSHFLGRHSTLFQRFFDWLFERTRRHSRSYEQWGALALLAFVAAPFPMTGAWSGCAAAFVFGIRFRYAFPAITAGVVIAASITTFAALGLLSWGGSIP